MKESHNTIFVLALGDIFSPRVLLISLVSLLLTIAVFIIGIWGLFGGLASLMDSVTQYSAQLENQWLFQMLSLFFITKTIITLLVFSMSAIVMYYLFLMVYSFIVGLFSSYFIKEIAQTYYPDVTLNGMGLLSYVWVSLKTLLLTSVLFIILAPLALMPVLNFMILIPVFYMFHKLLVLEVSSMVNATEEYRRLKKENAGALRGISFICFAMTLIPIVGVIIYPYYVIVMSHYIFRKTKEVRAL